MVTDDVEVVVVEIRLEDEGDKVRLGFQAPKETAIHRKEVWLALRREQNRGPSGLADAAE